MTGDAHPPDERHRSASGETDEPDEMNGTDGTNAGGYDRRRFLEAVGLGTAGLAAVAGTTEEATAAATTAADVPDDLDGRQWQLVWSDEFEGETIDTDTWTFETGGGCGEGGQLDTDCTWGNQESQYYTDGDNAWIEDGTLVLEAREEAAPSGIHDYTSARMNTAGGRTAQFGRVDIRATLPQGQGVWPALWMLGNDIGETGWPDCGEIDIMELIGNEPETVHGTVHGPGYSGGNAIGGGYTLDSGTFAEEPHTFSIVWDPGEIKWYVDGEQYHSVTREEVEAAGNEWVFDDRPFFYIFNIAVGGEWPGYPDETTAFPQQMRVEYIREYEPVESDGTTGDVVWSVNAGGDAYTAPDGTEFGADRDVTGGSTATTDAEIADTDADPLYQSERWGEFTYEVPVEAGTYDVDLHFAEFYWTDDSARVFDVTIEGEEVVSDLDIHAEVGANAATVETVSSVEVTDGPLTLEFVTEIDNAKVSAIAVSETDGNGDGGSGAPNLPQSVSAVDYDAADGDFATEANGEGGESIGWISAGDWWEYGAPIDAGGSVDLAVTVSSPYDGTALRVEVDGEDVSGTVDLPNTGGWYDWTTVTAATDVPVEADSTIRVVAETDGWNFDELRLE